MDGAPVLGHCMQFDGWTLPGERCVRLCRWLSGARTTVGSAQQAHVCYGT